MTFQVLSSSDLAAADRLCDRFALEGQFAPPASVDKGLPVDPWYRWVAELGVREGRNRGRAIKAAAGA